MGCMIAGIAVSVIAGVMWYVYFYQKEKKLLQRLYDMIEQAEEKSFDADAVSKSVFDKKVSEQKVSEQKISALEDRFRKFLNDSLLETGNNRQQKQAVQGLISDISHQTLTPISNLKLYSELLRETVSTGTSESELSGIMDTLCEQTEKLDFLIQSLVRLSRMETGLIGVHPRAGAIQSLFDTVCREYGKKAAEKNITLFFEKSSLHALFDLKWTSEAVGNIVDNAIKYTQDGGQVCVCARAYTFFVRIDVADNGIGIAPEEFSRIFARFYRSMSSDDQPGVGIGLYLAREIIRSQKGYIKVSSKEGEGAVFSVFLPYVQKCAE